MVGNLTLTQEMAGSIPPSVKRPCGSVVESLLGKEVTRVRFPTRALQASETASTLGS